MDVLVRGGLHLLGGIFGKNLLEALIDGFPLFLAEYAAPEQRAGMSAAGTNIDGEEDCIDPERPIQLFEDGIALLLKPSLP